MSIEHAVEDMRDPAGIPGDHPERARGACFNESTRFVAICDTHGIDAEVVSGFEFANGDPTLILNGHAAARVGDTVYDWTARQFPPHDQAVPLVQTYDEWRATWRDLKDIPHT